MPRATATATLLGGLALCVMTPAGVDAQTQAPGEDAIVRVSVDLEAAAFDRALPFDVPFLISGRVPAGTRRVEVQYAVLPSTSDGSPLSWMPAEPFTWTPFATPVAEEPFQVFVRAPLKPGRQYRLRFTLANDRAASAIDVDGRTARELYVSADLGVLYAGVIPIGAFYVGSNIYLRPVNKKAPIGATSLASRLSLTVGVTLSSIEDERSPRRSDLFWNQSLVLGGGYRVTRSLRAGGGALVFRQRDPNPLISRQEPTATWYLSFSLDFDVARFFL